MSSSPPSRFEINRRLARLHFSKAAKHYDASAIIQKEIADRLLERFSLVKINPKEVLDIGCGTGYSLAALAERFSTADITALDFAYPMVQHARERLEPQSSLLKKWMHQAQRLVRSPAPSFRWMNADMLQLPLMNNSMDVIHSCLALQWAGSSLLELFSEWHRVLNNNGVLFFATLGPDTLKELKQAFSTIEHTSHIHRFIDMHDIGDALLHVGFSDPVMEMETLTVQYTHPLAIFHDLKGIGAAYSVQDQSNRGLMGKSRWKRLLTAWENTQKEGKWPVTYEVIYGHAWKPPASLPTAEGYKPIQWMSR
jgi:malonyl-CoA O-methyltransferase